MCRWLAYSGTPMLLDNILYKPQHSLIDQSLHSRMGVETTNGDGFGIGWYSPGLETPAIIRDTGPAWNNRNLREIAHHVTSPTFFAHVRASTGTAIQQTNCHPFRLGRWLWMHNGSITDFHRLRRDLSIAIDPVLFSRLEGSTDSEVMFLLALSFGLDQNAPDAVARMVGLVEQVGHEHGVEFPMQMTVAVTDGERLWAFRYSSEGRSRSLFYSSRVKSLEELHPDLWWLQEVSPATRLVVSEPLGNLPDAWHEMPESTYSVVQPGRDELLPFTPLPVDPRDAAPV
ncbi:class II glutamine amidotransferase [Streptomyces sp. NPDC002574]|uniref:class II glutamine amidotransferase n=1 Tax=Streptomyces sp. NPDC002574 TaxID=3364652 RepID=UPI00367E57EC